MTKNISRRSVAKGAAWAIPAAIVATQAPAFATSKFKFANCANNNGTGASGNSTVKIFPKVTIKDSAGKVIETPAEGTIPTIWIPLNLVSTDKICSLSGLNIKLSVPNPNNISDPTLCSNPQSQPLQISTSNTSVLYVVSNPDVTSTPATPLPTTDVRTDGGDGGSTPYSNFPINAGTTSAEAGYVRLSGKEGTATFTATNEFGLSYEDENYNNVTVTYVSEFSFKVAVAATRPEGTVDGSGLVVCR